MTSLNFQEIKLKNFVGIRIFFYKFVKKYNKLLILKLYLENFKYFIKLIYNLVPHPKGAVATTLR